MSTFENLIDILKKNSSNFVIEAKVCDEENKFPVKSFEFLKENNFLSLLIPIQYGGYGLNFYEYQECLQAIAENCGSTASAFNMHSSIIGGLVEIFTSESSAITPTVRNFIEHIFSLVVNEKKVFASASSEPEIGGRVSRTKTTYEKCSGGYLLNGEKSFVTMASYADFYLTLANKNAPTNDPVNTAYLSYFIVDRQSPGLKIVDSWDTLGMRATQSHKVNFENVFVGNENIFLGVLGFALNKMLAMPHWIIGGYLGVYLGIMHAALNFTLDYIAVRTDKVNKTGLGYEKLVLSRVAQMYTKYQQAKLCLKAACDLVLQAKDSTEAHKAIYLAKYTIGESAMDLTAMAIKTCGGASISKSMPLERYFRDSRCCALMPTVSDVCEMYIARDLLSLPQENVW